MSHAPERQEKDCLNCGTIVQGRYCQHCGQENIVPKETFFGLVKHFFYDITHFDGKFFHSLKFLFTRPGFLPREFIRGRRARYLNPIRMYVFTSAFFFLLFFLLFKMDNGVHIEGNQPYNQVERDSALADIRQELKAHPGDEARLAVEKMLEDTTQEVRPDDINVALNRQRSFSLLTNVDYESVDDYYKQQKELPEAERDGWFKRTIIERQLHVSEEHRGESSKTMWTEILETFLHKLPYLLFISLPLFALILQLLYIRRKEYYYVDHGIFSIYHYIVSFIAILTQMLLDSLGDATGWDIFKWLEGIVFLFWLYYLYKSMRNFYGQKRIKTIVKFLILTVLAFTVNIALFLVFFFVSTLFT